MVKYFLCFLVLFSSSLVASDGSVPPNKKNYKIVVDVLRSQIKSQATWALKQLPVTITAESSSRSAGGKNDFFSEGDYWWPNPASNDSPYVQRDGMTNPDNFTAHRLAMIRFSKIMGALGSAYILAQKKEYVLAAMGHAKAWFVDPETRMNPSLLYAQAIKGRYTGRGIGIIDAIQLLEVVQTLEVMQKNKLADPNVIAATKKWFSSYLNWLTTHKYGIDEMNAVNNHGTCWVMQVSCFAKFVGNDSLMNFCSERFKTVLLPGQMAADGSFPKELARTKPYGYSLFNLDAMATICQILSTKENDLWNYKLPDGRCMQKGLSFIFPFVQDKKSWTFKQDVMYWDQWPVAHPFLVFGAAAFNDQLLFNTWKSLEHAPTEEEVIRNLPVRNPLIWFDPTRL
jgi:hypothetical protein